MERSKLARELYPDPFDTGSPTLDAINRHSTVIGVAPPSARSAPGPVSRGVPSGRYSYRLDESRDPLDVRASDLTLPDIRARLASATADMRHAMTENDPARIRRRIEDVEMLGRAIRRFELALMRGEIR